MKILILGCTGMLGFAVTQVFSQSNAKVIATARTLSAKIPPNVEVLQFDAEIDDLESLDFVLESGDFIINCIGIIKSEIDETNPGSRARAIRVNAEFPQRLARFAEARQFRVIQIATDCVYSGRLGGYDENSPQDPVDLYGLTKSQGEVMSANFMHLRVSIIGPETRGFTSLYEWIARQPLGSTIRGFTNHLWNGIPAKHFAKIALAVIEKDLFKSGVHHIVPCDVVSKATLVRLIAKHADRHDLVIVDYETEQAIDRSLRTISRVNSALWAAAGYDDLPSIARLVSEI
jgi:dTDP-4-dehydrorhamnose reductase